MNDNMNEAQELDRRRNGKVLVAASRQSESLNMELAFLDALFPEHQHRNGHRVSPITTSRILSDHR